MAGPAEFFRKHRKLLISCATVIVAAILVAVYLHFALAPSNQNGPAFKDLTQNVVEHDVQPYSHPLSGHVSLNMTPQMAVVALHLNLSGEIYFPALQFNLTTPGGKTISTYWVTDVYPYGWKMVNETPQYFGFEVQYESTHGDYLLYVYNSTSTSNITLWVAPPKGQGLSGFGLSVTYLLGIGTVNFKFPANTPTPIYASAP